MAEKKSEVKSRLKILMLHGYTQNGALFKDRTGGIRKALKQLADLVYIDAPHDVPKFSESTETEEPTNAKEEKSRGWYTKIDENKVVDCVNQSLDYLNDVFKTQGPFDGVWGFSQGATLTHFLSCIAVDNQKQSNSNPNRGDIRFNFAILTATSKSSHADLDGLNSAYYKNGMKLEIPSMHIIGKTDKITNFEKALELSEYYINPKVYVHEFGHFIPGDKDSKNVYVEFLELMKNQTLKV